MRIVLTLIFLMISTCAFADKGVGVTREAMMTFLSNQGFSIQGKPIEGAWKTKGMTYFYVDSAGVSVAIGGPDLVYVDLVTVTADFKNVPDSWANKRFNEITAFIYPDWNQRKEWMTAALDEHKGVYQIGDSEIKINSGGLLGGSDVLSMFIANPRDVDALSH